MKNILLIIATLILISAGNQTFAGDKRGEHKHHGMEKREKLNWMRKKLDLSEDQVFQIKAIRAEHRAKKRESLANNNGESWQFIDPASSDFLALSAERARKKAERLEDKFIKRAEMQAEIFTILTPEQQEQYSALKRKKHEKKKNKAMKRRQRMIEKANNAN